MVTRHLAIAIILARRRVTHGKGMAWQRLHFFLNYRRRIFFPFRSPWLILSVFVLRHFIKYLS